MGLHRQTGLTNKKNMAAIKIFLENNMVNFQQTGDKIPYGRNQVEPRYKDTTVSFYHEDLATLKFVKPME